MCIIAAAGIFAALRKGSKKSSKGSKNKAGLVQTLTEEVDRTKHQLSAVTVESKRQLEEVSAQKLLIEQNLQRVKSAHAVDQEVRALEQRIKEEEHSFDQERLTLLAKSQRVAAAGDLPFRELYERSQAQLASQLQRNKRIEEDHLATVMRIQQQFDSTKKQLVDAFQATLARVSEENRALAEKGLTRDVQQKLAKHLELQREVEMSRSAARKVLLQLHRVERMYTRVMLDTTLWKEKCHLLEARIVEIKRKAAGRPPLSKDLKEHMRETQVKGSLMHPPMEPLTQSKDERIARESLETFAKVAAQEYKQANPSPRRQAQDMFGTDIAASHGSTSSAPSPKRGRRRHLEITTDLADSGTVSYPFGIAQQLDTTISEAKKIKYSELDENMHVVARLLAETSNMVEEEQSSPNLATSLLPDSPLKRQSSARDMQQFTAFAAAHVNAARAASDRAEQLGNALRHAPSDPALALLQSSKAARRQDKLFPEHFTHTLPSRNKTGLKGFVTVGSPRAAYVPSSLQPALQRSAMHVEDRYLKPDRGQQRQRPASAAPNTVAKHSKGTGARRRAQDSKAARPQSARPTATKRPGSSRPSSAAPSELYGSSLKPTERMFPSGRRASGSFKFLLQGTAAGSSAGALQSQAPLHSRTSDDTGHLILGHTF